MLTLPIFKSLFAFSLVMLPACECHTFEVMQNNAVTWNFLLSICHFNFVK